METVRIHKTCRKRPRARARWLGLAGGLYSCVFGKRLPAITSRDLQKRDFRLSTQRMGVRFTNRIRDTFRFLWLRKIS